MTTVTKDRNDKSNRPGCPLYMTNER